jgi:multidrug resistance efflux pump
MKALKIFRSGKALANVMSVCIWFIALACVIGLLYKRSQRFEVLGIAQGQVRQVAATCDGRLVSVPVQLFEQVKVGDTVAVIDAVLDNEVIQEQLQTATAEIEHLQAQLAHTQETLLAEAQNLQNRLTTDQRRFYVDVENAKLRLLELEAQNEIDRLTLKENEASIKESQTRFVDTPSTSPDADFFQLKVLKAQSQTLEQKMETTKRHIEQAKLTMEQAQQRLEDFLKLQPQTAPIDIALEVLQKAITVQQLRVKELLARTKPVILQSPIDGMIIQVQGRPRDVALRRPGELVIRRAGEVVIAGDSVVTIAEMQPREIIAYLDQSLSSRVTEGMSVKLVKNQQPAQLAQSQVAHVGYTLERMPEWLWEVPNLPQWGIPILIEIPPGMKLIPGETVGIKGL